MENYLNGQGVPWDQIMENEFEYLSDRRGHGGHLAEKFKKNIVPIPSYCGYCVMI